VRCPRPARVSACFLARYAISFRTRTSAVAVTQMTIAVVMLWANILGSTLGDQHVQ
jgi:hypothetical protein